MKTPEQLFVQVVEAGSFKKAADLLHLEPSSLSRKIATLEQRLQVKLLHRSTQKTRPTELGQRYYQGLREIIDEQMALEEEIISGVNAIKGKLRIAATVDFGEKFIVPVIQEMQQQAPDLSVELLLSSDVDDLAEKNLDIAIRFGPLPDSKLIARKVGEIPKVLVASPDYLHRHGTPRVIQDLDTHNFILYSSSQARKELEFTNGTHYPSTRLRSNITINSIRAIHSMVLGGSGINLGPGWLYQDDLLAGNLVQVLPELTPKPFTVFAVYAARNFLPQKTKIFIQRITGQIQLIHKSS